MKGSDYKADGLRGDGKSSTGRRGEAALSITKDISHPLEFTIHAYHKFDSEHKVHVEK